MKFDHGKFISLYKLEYGALDTSQASGLSGLLGFLEKDNHLNDVRSAAYMLATVKHECANRWQPIEEFGKGQGMAYGNPVTIRGSDGKTYINTYYGRGYVQLTWVDNYRNMSYNLNLGDDVLIHPERALEAPIAYRIMSFGMRNGSFTGVRLSDYINGSKCEYYDARQIINGHDQAALIQGYAQKLESLLKESSNGKEGSKATSTSSTDLQIAITSTTNESNASSYLLGHSEAETKRLFFQAQMLRPITENLLRKAGIESKMKVLDLGCGAGDVSFLAAELVGPHGVVVGVDQSAYAIEAARTRAAKLGLRSISFVASSVEALSVCEQFDAVVGRYILHHQKEPVAMVRKAATFVGRGGIIAFHEIGIHVPFQCLPDVPLWRQAWRWIHGVFRQSSAQFDVTGRNLC